MKNPQDLPQQDLSQQDLPRQDIPASIPRPRPFGKRNAAAPLPSDVERDGKRWFTEARDQAARDERDANRQKGERRTSSDGDLNTQGGGWFSDCSGDSDGGGDGGD